MTDVRIGGEVAAGAGALRDAFALCFGSLGETGAACCAWRDGRLLADLWGGEAAPGSPWARETRVCVYSTGKPFAALGLLLLVDRGVVELDAPVARYWPEYAAAGKGGTTVRHVLTHRAGLMALDPPLPGEALLDWERVTTALAAAPPNWEPGAEQGEHAVFYGHLVGEIARRVTGVPFGEWLRREIANAWGLECTVALRPDEQSLCATLRGMDDAWIRSLATDPGSLRDRALFASTGMLRAEVVNGRAWRAACVPAVGVHATARGIAALYAGLLADGLWKGARLVSAATARAMRTEHGRGYDHFCREEVRWGLGVQLDTDGFGHGGLGGSLGWADPATGTAFAYVTARMGGHERATAVWEAVRRT